MKKKIVAVALGMAIAASMTACGNSDVQSTETTENNAEAVTENSTASSETSSFAMKVNPEEHVESLCDYSAIPVSISAAYEVTEENIASALSNLLVGYGLGTAEVTDRTIVEPGDYVNVDYTGYQDGEAFSGGTAEDVLIDVSNNMDVNRGTGYIEGFSDGLIGAEVGTTIDCDVTFPENYGVDSLNGQTVTFEFVINGIYAPVTADELTDEDVEAAFGEDYGITTKDALTDFVEQYMEASYYQAVVNAAKEYVVANSQFNFPDEYMVARLREYEDSYAQTYCTEGQSLEDYFATNYSMSLEEAEIELMSFLEEQVGIEFAFSVIANEIGVEVVEEELSAYAQNFVGNTSMGFDTLEDVYNYFGAGNQADGEAYLRDLYRVNKAIDYVADNAVVTYTN